MTERLMLRVADISKSYPQKNGEPVRAVENVSFAVKPGEIVGFLGPNGAGKTTTVKMICGLIRPDSGRVFVDGIDVWHDRHRALDKLSAVLEGNRNIYWRLTVRENLEFFAALKGKDPNYLQDQINYYLDFFDLVEKSHVEARKLSRGMQQKLAVAVAMVSQSELILLDEPTLGLDVKASYEIRGLLRKIVEQDGRTVILTTHDMNVVQDICERVIIVNQGRIIAEDRVENLLELFNMKVYQIRIKGSLGEEQLTSLALIPDLEIKAGDGCTNLVLRLDNSQVLYDVISILESRQSEIEAIDRQENNFEKVFMEIIQGGGSRDQGSAIS